VNLGERTARVSVAEEPLLTSGPVAREGDWLVMPPDTAVWWSTSRSGQVNGR
jgi:hypothetical protein